MRNMRKILCIFILSLFIAGIGIYPAFAEESHETGSISIWLKDEDGAIVTSGTLTLYQVADISDNKYVYLDIFSDCGLSLDDITTTSFASNLAEYVENNSISGVSVSVDSNGKVSFSDLDLGLYLIIQTENSDGYYTISPFIVTIPYSEGDNVIYDVDASPKVGVLKKTDITTTTTEMKLPQTGQLNWPIPVCALTGILSLMIGFKLTRENKHEA